MSKNTLAELAVEIYSFRSKATTFPQEMSNIFRSVAWLHYGKRPGLAGYVTRTGSRSYRVSQNSASAQLLEDHPGRGHLLAAIERLSEDLYLIANATRTTRPSFRSH